MVRNIDIFKIGTAMLLAIFLIYKMSHALIDKHVKLTRVIYFVMFQKKKCNWQLLRPQLQPIL